MLMPAEMGCGCQGSKLTPSTYSLQDGPGCQAREKSSHLLLACKLPKNQSTGIGGQSAQRRRH